MQRIERMLADNETYVEQHRAIDDSKPTLRIAVVTCMDARIDVFAVLGLRLGEVHVIRNAGGRITADVLRSLALSVNVLAVDTVVVMQHTKCGVEHNQDDLVAQTGAEIDFLTIQDHTHALSEDISTLMSLPYLNKVHTFASLLFNIESGQVKLVDQIQRKQSAS